MVLLLNIYSFQDIYIHFPEIPSTGISSLSLVLATS